MAHHLEEPELLARRSELVGDVTTGVWLAGGPRRDVDDRDDGRIVRGGFMDPLKRESLKKKRLSGS